ncbi:GntR family transcriptional regulator [Calidifontibacter terrae]
MRGPASEAVADRLRELILDGELGPGDHLDELGIATRLEVSRNTLREGFRALALDGLVEHRSHRGVFVRRPTVKELQDAYATRRLLECGALRQVAERRAAMSPDERNSAAAQRDWESRLVAVDAAVERGIRSAARGDWRDVGSANGQFHLAVAQLGDNAYVHRAMRVLVTEVRLLFLLVGSARAVHEPYLIDNQRVASLIRADALVAASIALEAYLLRAETHLVGEYRALERAAGRVPD